MNDCIFCKIIKGSVSCDKVYEDKEILGFLDISPVNPGHTLVIPKKHYITMFDVPDDLLKKIVLVAKKVAKSLIVTKEGGVNVIVNNYASAGQLVPHLHFHIIPRHIGDGHVFSWKSHKYESDKQKEEYRKAIQKSLG